MQSRGPLPTRLALAWLRMSFSLQMTGRSLKWRDIPHLSVQGDVCSSPVELIFVDIIYDCHRTVNGQGRVLSSAYELSRLDRKRVVRFCAQRRSRTAWLQHHAMQSLWEVFGHGERGELSLIGADLGDF